MKGSWPIRKSVRKSIFGRRFSKDRSGASEVLGDILLVSMSVVLVSIVAYQVGKISAPTESTKIDLVATIDGNNLVINHMGGEKIQEKNIKIYVGAGSIASQAYNLSDGLGGAKTMKIGQKWSQNISTLLIYAQNTNQQVFVQVIDTKGNSIILDQILRKGMSTAQFPDVGLDKTSLKYSNNLPETNVFIVIYVKVVNYGPVNVTNLNVRFFDGTTFIGTNNTILKLNRTGLPFDNKTVTILWRTSYIGKHIISVTVVPKLNETNLANNYLSKDLMVGAMINPDFIKPNLIVKTLGFSKETPKSKETVVVTAQIGNTAKITATGFQLRWGDVFEGKNTTLNTTTYLSNVSYIKDVFLKYEWTPQRGGNHLFWVLIINVLPSGEDPTADANPDLDRDYLNQRVEVLPTILLVNDGRAGKGSVRDTITAMRESLGFIGLSPDVVVVSGGDGPQYAGSGLTLDKYDVVIWETGYENTNTLTTTGPTNDVGNLQQYLNHNGSLWLIGQDITNDLWNNGGVTGKTFLSNYLRVSGQTLDIGITNPIIGNSLCAVTKGLTLKTYVAPGLPNKADQLTPNGAIAAMDNATHKNISLLTNQSTRADAKGYKVAFFAFEYAQISSSSDRAILAYEIMTWFNATVTIAGDDLAISEVTITPQSPHFKQEVLIKATIRSNGLTDLNGVKVVFKDVFMGIEKVIDPVATSDPKRAPNPLQDSPDTNNPMSIDILGRGGMNVTYKYWTPDKIGAHYIKVVVDPNDVIKEFNEENNEFVSELDPTNVFVDSITLVVDDDQSALAPTNSTKNVVDALKFLGYKYEVFTVAGGGIGPGIDKMTKYNSIIWVLGKEGNADTMKKEDTTNLSSYLINYDDSKLFVIGENLGDDKGLNHFWDNKTFRRNIMGLADTSTACGAPPCPLAMVYGIKNNNITHGMQYPLSPPIGFSVSPDKLVPYKSAETIFTDGSGSSYAVAFANTSGVNYKVVTLGFEYSFINSVNYQRELMFQVLRWFGQVDNRIELKVTYDDMFFGQDNGPSIQFANQHPVLGASYILQAKIWNMGGTPGGAVVRFVDGTTVINSVNVYVPATTWDTNGKLIPGTAMAEVIWTPLFAGNRPLTVKVDPDMNVPLSADPRDTTGEIYKFNNNATRTIAVYFFYDDMENGVGNWNHDTTIVNINGEQPIEYFDRLRPIETKVIGDWIEPINPWEKDITHGYSQPSSFKVKEPNDLNMSPNLRISVCIDDSGSMRNGNLASDPGYLRLDAVLNFINSTLTTGDELAIYRFDYTSVTGDYSPSNARVSNLYWDKYGTSIWEDAPFANQTWFLKDRGYPPNWPSMTDGGHTFNNQGGTPLYDCIVRALNDQQLNYAPPVFLYPAVIVLTDGLDASSTVNTYQSAFDKASSSGIPLFTVGLGGSVDDDILFSLAEKSNSGKYYFASSAGVLNSTLQRISSAIGSGSSRSAKDTDNGDGPSSRGMDGPASSRAITDLRVFNPSRSGSGGTAEKWGIGSNINVTWRCRDTADQTKCGHATISLSLNGGGNWNVIANNVGTMVANGAGGINGWTYGEYDRNGGFWYNQYIYVYNWTVPSNPTAQAVLRIAETGANLVTVQSDSRSFTIFDMGITTGAALPATEKKIISKGFELKNYESAKLSFWQRYDLLFGENGGVVQIGISGTENGVYNYKYVQPMQTYTGNLRLQANQKTGITDSYGNDIIWAWNGRSGGGTYSWEYVEVSLTEFIGNWVKLKFSFYTWGYGNGGDWAIDNVKVTAKRAETGFLTLCSDQWEYYKWTSGVNPVEMQPHSGTHMWWNHNPGASEDLKSGNDNSLYTKSIDLTNAKDAVLSAYFKFNLDDAAGRPPDGFRVEISNDNGVSWNPINLGVRSSWGVSGNWLVDGKSADGKKAYTGIQDGGPNSATPVWVEANSLWRLNTNLSGWSGSVIKIRFRVVTNLDPTHTKAATTFRGFAIDDVLVRGNTTLSGSPIIPIEHMGAPDMQPYSGASHGGTQKGIPGTEWNGYVATKDQEK